jgi:hypothetical protein
VAITATCATNIVKTRGYRLASLTSKSRAERVTPNRRRGAHPVGGLPLNAVRNSHSDSVTSEHPLDESECILSPRVCSRSAGTTA